MVTLKQKKDRSIDLKMNLTPGKLLALKNALELYKTSAVAQDVLTALLNEAKKQGIDI